MSQTFRLKDYNNQSITYNASKIRIPVASGEGFAEFITTPVGKKEITNTIEVDVLNYATAQINDLNLIPANIKKDINILGVTGSYEGGVTPSGNVDIETTAQYDVSTKATAQISESNCNKLIAANIRSGEIILGIEGSLIERPSWVAASNNGTWTNAYMNPDVDWSTILRGLTYFDNYSLIGLTNGLGAFLAIKNGNNYALGYVTLTDQDMSLYPIFATESGTYVVNTGEINVRATFISGWNMFVIPIPSGVLSCSFVSYLGIDPTTIAAGDELAFGRWIKKPTAGTTLTITANGTYTFEQLSQYETIIINVPTSSSDENVTVSGDTMSFDGDTTVSDDTLILNANAEISGDTLTFINANDPTVSGNDLVFDGSETISGDMLALDGTVDGDTLFI